MLGLQIQIGAGVDVADQVIGAEPAAGVLAGRTGADGDVVDGVAVAG